MRLKQWFCSSKESSKSLKKNFSQKNSSSISHRVFGTGSGFRVGWRAVAGGGGGLFVGFLLVFAGFSFLRGDWALGYHSMPRYRHFPNIS